MSMNLKLVVYNKNGQEFVAEGRKGEALINKVIGANLDEEKMGAYDAEERKDISNLDNYSVFDINWMMFEDIMRRNKYATTINDVIVLYA